MKFSLHYSILLVAATVACVAAAPTTTDPDAIVQEKVLSVAHRLEVVSNKFDQEKTVIAQKKTVARKELEAAQALADKLGGEAATARELATGFKETAEQTRQTVVTSLGDAVNAYTRAKESYEKISGTPELDEEVLQNLRNKHENALSAIDANSIGRNAALFAALEADTKEKAADEAKTTVAGYALSIEQLTEDENEISQKKQALGDRLSPCVNDMECSITSIIGDNIEEPVDEINTVEDEVDEINTVEDEVDEINTVEDEVDEINTVEDEVDEINTVEDEVDEINTVEDEADEDEIDPTLTGSDPNQVEEGHVDKDKTGTADDKAKTADDTDAEDMVDELVVNKKAAEEQDSEMKVENEEEGEMEVDATKTLEQETPEDKAAEKKKLEEIASEKEKKEKRVKDAARKKAEEVAEQKKASEKVNKNKKDKAAKKDEEAEVVAEEGEATKKGEMKGEDKTVQEEKAGENDETKGVDKTVQEENAGENNETKGVDKTVQEENVGENGETVQEEKAGESGEKKGEDKKNAVVQDSGAKFNQPAVAVGILSVMSALAFGV